MTKRYYKTIKFYKGTDFITEIWHCSHITACSLSADVIIPLSHKPKAGTFDLIREGV